VDKIISLEQFNSVFDGTTVLVGGCFDMLHIGHINLFKKAKQHGDKLIIALESDEFMINTKKKQPFHNQVQRAEILSALQDVDEVVLLPYLQTYNDYLAMVKKIHPRIIAVTKNDPQISNKRKQAEAIGAQVLEVIDYLPQYSSSLLREHINKHKDVHE
jgi:FAD synthetase